MLRDLPGLEGDGDQSRAMFLGLQYENPGNEARARQPAWGPEFITWCPESCITGT